IFIFFFFFQAEDGIRDFHVTGVQTCALPIFATSRSSPNANPPWGGAPYSNGFRKKPNLRDASSSLTPSAVNTRRWSSGSWIRIRSEERRVGKECRAGGSAEP